MDRARLLRLTAVPVLLALLIWWSGNAAGATDPHRGQAQCAPWRNVPAPQVPGAILGVAGTSPSDVWAIGSAGVNSQPIIMHWDGAAWGHVDQEPMTGAPGGAVALSTDDAWAVGADLFNAPFSMHWDGTLWRQVDIPTIGTFDNLNDVTAVSPTDIWAGGNYTQPDGIHPLVEHWDGTSWTQVFAPDGVPNSANVFYGISAVSANDIWAVGYTEPSGLNHKPLIEHWDGVAWKVIDSPRLPGNDNILYGVSALSSADVWAVGHRGDSGTELRILAEHWDGISWRVVPTPNVEGTLDVLLGVDAVSATDAWAVGIKGGVPSLSVTMHWDGTRWTTIPVQAPGDNNALEAVAAITPLDLWAGGSSYDPSIHNGRPLTLRSKGCSS